MVVSDTSINQHQSNSASLHKQHPSYRSLAGSPKRPASPTSPVTFTVPVLSSNTHNVTTNGHLHSVQKFSEDLSAAVKAAWPTRHESRYSDVQVLILSWEDDDLGVFREIEVLRRTFRDLFNYEVSEWTIPQQKPERKLNLEIGKFLEQHDHKDHLLIVYYAGHGCLNEQRVPMWAAYVLIFARVCGTMNSHCYRRRDASSPTLSSNSVQSQLEEADSDVLLLLDCCHAAHPTLTDADHGVTEAIAACGFETTAPGVGPHSFTNALIRELEIASQGPPISVAKLHGRILWRLKTWKPSLQRDRDGNLWQDEDGKIPTEQEQRVTAVHCFLTNEVLYRSIMLAPLRDSPYRPPTTPSSRTTSPPSSPTSVSGSHTALHSGSTTGSPTGTTTSSSISEPDKAQVLISISIDSSQIENNQAENVKIWTEILRLLPPAATGIKIQGFYGSFSKLVLVSMPVPIWDMLPENPAYSFVGFVTTENMMPALQRAPSRKRRVDDLDDLLFRGSQFRPTQEDAVMKFIREEGLVDLKSLSLAARWSFQFVVGLPKSTVRAYDSLRYLRKSDIVGLMILAAVVIMAWRDIRLMAVDVKLFLHDVFSSSFWAQLQDIINLIELVFITIFVLIAVLGLLIIISFITRSTQRYREEYGGNRPGRPERSASGALVLFERD